MRIDVLREDAEFDELQAEWDGLLSLSRQDNPFLMHHWVASWWRHFRPAKARLAIVTCREGDRLVGVAPLFSGVSGRIVSARIGRLLADQGVGSTGLSPFAHPAVEQEVFGRIAAFLRREDRLWDVLELRYLDNAAPFFQRMTTIGRARVIEGAGFCPRLELPATWDSYLAEMPKRRRQEIGRTMRRAAGQGFAVEMVEEAGSVPGVVEELLGLHQGRMRRKFGEEYAVSPAFRAFTHETTARMLADGRLRLYSMRHEDGHRPAVNYMLRHGDIVYGELYGFADTEEARHLLRPLIAEGIKRSIEEGCTMLDMLLGDQHHKAEWGVTEVRELANVRLYGRSSSAFARRGRDAVVEWRPTASQPSA